MKLTIVPGWGEGKRQMAEAMRELIEGGIPTQYSRTLSRQAQYEGIVAHSGGCYQYWSRVHASHLFLIAPPWHKLGRFTSRELARRARVRRGEAESQRSTLQSLRFLASLRSTFRHRRAVLQIDLVGELTEWLRQDTSRHIDLVVYRSDIWTDLEIKQAFAPLPRTKVTILTGQHDDLRRRPEDIVHTVLAIIKK